ncbi:unnamed protein product [Prunus armeniaca]|uniref:Uncharacterized protein n=1 Tax=Prunus armeniaca TaxID=36596 RepID=A0A6J5V6F4_PRUAR|nr:unnamed protein product [Prunus armeniaca]CAB4313687.1 unnamed protein product [Prunus armeniaca]
MSSKQDVTLALWHSTNDHRGSLSQPPPQNDNGGHSLVKPNVQDVFGRENTSQANDNGEHSSVQPNVQDVFGR